MTSSAGTPPDSDAPADRGRDPGADSGSAPGPGNPESDGILVVVNGEERRIPEGISVRGLLEHLELEPALVVVERNREIVERDRYDRVEVDEGDRFELVHFVGGG